MGITVLPPPLSPPEEGVCISHHDAQLIAKIRDNLGKIDAIVVTRWLTKTGLRASKQLVESLPPYGPIGGARCSTTEEQPQ